MIDSIKSRVNRDSHYQLEEVQDWDSHLEQLQAILIEFDADGAPEASDMIRFFREDLKPSIKAQMEQRGRELKCWDELVEKAIEAVRSWAEPKSVRDIQDFIGFANFYRRFIQGFSKIAAPLTSVLKTSSSTGSSLVNPSAGVTSNFRLRPMKILQELQTLG